MRQEFGVDYFDTLIHDHRQPGGFGFAGRFMIDHPLLHPDGSSAHRNGLLHHRQNLVGAAEDIDNIDTADL